MVARDVFVDVRNYLAGQFVGATRDETLLGEAIKCLFVAKVANKVENPFPFVEATAVQASVYFRRVFQDIVKQFPDLFDEDSELLLGPEDLQFTMRQLWRLDLSASSDVVGDAYEVFVGSALRGQEGQFFTPRNAISFLVEATGPTSSDRIIDPACGTGGFLSKTALALVEKGASYKDIKVFGIDKDAQLVRLTKIHLALLGFDYKHVHTLDSLSWNGVGEAAPSSLLGEGEYDVVLTNPPFGARIVAAKPSTARNFDLAHNWICQTDGRWVKDDGIRKRLPPQLLFLEKCIRLLRPSGRCGMVVPESLISSMRYRFAVQYLRERADILIVAGMPEALFKTSGMGATHTKTALLVFEKKQTPRLTRQRPLFLAEAKWCGNDSRGRPIPHDDLETILARYRAGETTESTSSELGFWLPEKAIENQSLSPRRYNPEIQRAIRDLESTHDVVQFGNLVDTGVLQLRSGDEVGKLAYGGGDVPFIRTSEISNWEIKSDPKHLVDNDIYESLKDKQDVRESDILMVKDGTYLIGTCGFVTRDDVRMVYQSHLYKIRVTNNLFGLDSFLLLAILSSPVVQSQVRAKRVTHDIIDSLGTRILELMLPIPCDENDRREISDQVEMAVQYRLKARTLAARARLAVANSRYSSAMSTSPSSK